MDAIERQILLERIAYYRTLGKRWEEYVEKLEEHLRERGNIEPGDGTG